MTNGAGSGGPPPASHAAGPSIGTTPRRSSYASVVSGAPAHNHASPARAGAFSHLINFTPSSSYPPQYQPDHRYSRHSSGPESEMNTNGSVPFGSAWRKHTSLPSYSRQFANLPSFSANSSLPSSTFFVPSYLRNSRYVAKLEAEHRKRVAAQQEAPSTHSSNAASLSTSSSNVNLHRMAPSHRGMTYEIIENIPASEDDLLMPLPSRWSESDKYPGLDLPGDGLEIRYTGSTSKTEMEAAAARGDYPMSPQCGIYYYEVEVKNRSKDGMIAVGFSSQKASLERLPGWESESWAYHGDDGKMFLGENGSGRTYGPTFTANDVIGCGVNFVTGCAFFTKNGVDLGVAFRDLRNIRPFPSVGMKKHSGAWISANFGQKPFVFDIDGMIAREQLIVEKDISVTKVTSLHPPLDEGSLVQELVAHFLAHDGYVETAKAFGEEMRAESRALQSNQNSIANIMADEDFDAINRQSTYSKLIGISLLTFMLGIRASILEGDIDKALKYTNAYYPQVLDDNPAIVFRLKCRKYVELIRKCSDLQSTPEKEVRTMSNGHSHALGGAVFEQDMELDDQMSGGDEWDKMDTEEAENAMKYQELLREAMEYGQVLMREYRDERRECRKALENIFSLIAYDDAKSSVHGHLLDPAGRVAVAEELNSAILGNFYDGKRV